MYIVTVTFVRLNIQKLEQHLSLSNHLGGEALDEVEAIKPKINFGQQFRTTQSDTQSDLTSCWMNVSDDEIFEDKFESLASAEETIENQASEAGESTTAIMSPKPKSATKSMTAYKTFCTS